LPCEDQERVGERRSGSSALLAELAPDLGELTLRMLLHRPVDVAL